MDYKIKQIKKFNNLEDSLKEISQVEPIITFIDNNDIEYIVDGNKRFNILKKMNRTIQKKTFKDLIKLFAFILDSQDIYDSSVWKYFHIFSKNNFLENDIHNIIKDRIKLSVRDIWKLLKIEYKSKIEKLITELNISLKELTSYYELESSEFESLLIFFKNLNLNKNNRKSLFTLINEITKRENITILNLINKKEILEIINSDLQSNNKIDLLKNTLFKLRYPIMSKEINELKKLKNKIKTPGFKLDLPIEKESNRSSISFQFRNYKELGKKINTLQEFLKNENIKEILDKIENR